MAEDPTGKFQRPSELALQEALYRGDLPIEEFLAWGDALCAFDKRLARERERTKEYKKSAGGPETL